MTRLSRREVLRLATALGLLPIAACGDGSTVADGSSLPEYESPGELGPEGLFSHSVASGDPLADRVILWTKVSPGRDGTVDVFWEMAETDDFAAPIAAGWFPTDESRDHTVKIDVSGLLPGATYYYRFRALDRASATGRTRTAPVGDVERVRMAVASCSRYSSGYFHAYRGIAARDDLDVVLHLGDYIYEYQSNGRDGERAHLPDREIVTLDDYRARYAQYRSDPDLQEAHRRHPWVVVWDDHESANNGWRDGAQNHQPDEGSWVERRLNAERAYSEWLPIRDQADGRIFRAFRFGDLVDLTMLDTRLWGRSASAEDAADLATIRDPERTILGFDQEEWLDLQVRDSSAQWFVLGQQVAMSQTKVIGLPNSEGGGTIFNVDQWDGYEASRTRFFDSIERHGRDNLVVLTGDLHVSGAGDLSRDPNEPSVYEAGTGRGTLGVEMLTTSVTSPSTSIPAGVEDIIFVQNPAVRYVELDSRGYLVLDIDHERARGEWYLLEDVWAQEAVERLDAAWMTRSGAGYIEEA